MPADRAHIGTGVLAPVRPMAAGTERQRGQERLERLAAQIEAGAYAPPAGEVAAAVLVAAAAVAEARSRREGRAPCRLPRIAAG